MLNSVLFGGLLLKDVGPPQDTPPLQPTETFVLKGTISHLCTIPLLALRCLREFLIYLNKLTTG